MSDAQTPDRVRLLALAELAEGEARRCDVGEHRIAVVRIGDEVRAIGDTCSHADYSLSEGELDADECTLECPKHGSAFSLVDGEPQSLPALRPVPVYPVVIEDDDVWVTLP